MVTALHMGWRHVLFARRRVHCATGRLGYDIQSTPILVGATAASQLCMFGVGYLYYRFRDLTVPVALPSVRELGYVAGGVVVAITAAVVLSMLLTSFGLLPSSVIGDTAATNPTYLLGLAALSIVVVAPVEDFAFGVSFRVGSVIGSGRLLPSSGPASSSVRCTWRTTPGILSPSSPGRS
ncbi:hypothetical protein [Halogranum rubrum]|uniref:hypothetical protein n=1 Tax=Halogranum rubrum TaxID=553466 RepID=UPI001ED98066|nr:hypothetical protein [Halogranum salarium]